MIFDLHHCDQCEEETGQLNFAKIPIHEFIENEIKGAVCEKGHKTIFISNSHKYENLTYLSFTSLKGLFYHGAVTSITTAFEKFQDFIIAYFLTKNGVEINLVETAFKKNKLSERRLGGYTYLFLNEFKKLPPLPRPDKEVKFRNNVIHNGYVCSKDETEKYVLYIYNLIRETLNIISESDSDLLKTIEINTTYSMVKADDYKVLGESKYDVLYPHDYYKYTGLRDLTGKMTSENFDKLLEKVPDFNKLRISKLLKD